MTNKMVFGKVSIQEWIDELKRIITEIDPDSVHWMSFDEETWYYEYIAGYTPQETIDEKKGEWV